MPQPARVASPCVQYADRLLAAISQSAANLSRITAAAEQAAARMVAGGKIWIAGDEGFVTEGSYRAGGMMALQALDSAAKASAGDVVLLGTLAAKQADRDLVAAAEARGALVVLFAPQDLPGTHLFINAFAPAADNPQALPITSPALADNLWAFTGELVGALTRLGKMPPMFESVLVPGGNERNATHLKLQWEPGTPQPAPAGLLGRQYFARLANCLRQLKGSQAELFAGAAGLAADTRAAGGTVYCELFGHLPPFEAGQVGDPNLCKPLTQSTPEKIGQIIKPGDLVLYVGYYEPYGPWVEQVHGLGARIVTVVSGTPERMAAEMGADINISGCWPYGDALVAVPGYDVHVLPPSGVVASAAYWMLVAEMGGTQ